MNARMPFPSCDATPFKLSSQEESYKLRGYRINNSMAYIETFIGGKELREYRRLGRRCHICNDYGTVECAHVWRLSPQAFLGAAFGFLSR